MYPKKDVFIITGTEIYSKIKDKSITFKFMFDSGIDFEQIREYEKYGMIKLSDKRWFLTAGKSGRMVYSGGINVINEEYFKDTVYLMDENEFHRFIEEYGEKIDYNVFHSKKSLYQN